MKIIKEEYSIGTYMKSVHFTKIIEGDKGLKIKVNIKSDSYDFQSHATVSVFNPHDLKWNIIDSIHYSNMKTPHNLYNHLQLPQQNASVLASKFLDDTNTLVSNAEAILGDSFSNKCVAKKTVTQKLKP
jgi:hypothetical protein